jgi:hypothetical protein
LISGWRGGGRERRERGEVVRDNTMITYVEFVVSEKLIFLLIFPKHSMFNNAIQNCPSLISGQNRHEKEIPFNFNNFSLIFKLLKMAKVFIFFFLLFCLYLIIFDFLTTNYI